MSEIAEFTRHLGNYLPPPDIALVERAFQFSDSAHRGQFRKSGEPYITHPLAVASILSQWRLDAQGLAAALLHDVMEDTAITKSEIETSFGKPVADMVDGALQARPDRVQLARGRAGRELPQDAARDGAGRARHPDQARRPAAQHAHARRDGAAAPAPHRARDARHLRADRQPARPQRALPRAAGPRVQAPLPDALPDPRQRDQGGARQPARGDEPAARRDPRRLRQGGHHRRRLGPREDDLLGLQEDAREALHVLAGVRHLRRARAGRRHAPRCYAALGVLHGLYKPIPGKFKDYIAIPKANGYQSLHTTLFGPFGTPLEAQIRTHDMHRIAEAGVAAHWLYKIGGELDLAQAQRETHRWLQSLLEIQSESRDSKEFLENIKGDLFPDEIYVFTPKGKIMALPRGATAVDFAYARAHRHRPSLRRRAHQLRADAAAHRAEERRPRRDPDLAHRAAQSVVAVVRRHRQGALADPPFPQGPAAEGVGGARRAAARPGARHAQGRAGVDHVGALGGAAEGVRRQEPARHPRRHRPRQAAVVRRRAGADAARRESRGADAGATAAPGASRRR